MHEWFRRDSKVLVWLRVFHYRCYGENVRVRNKSCAKLKKAQRWDLPYLLSSTPFYTILQFGIGLILQFYFMIAYHTTTDNGIPEKHLCKCQYTIFNKFRVQIDFSFKFYKYTRSGLVAKYRVKYTGNSFIFSE